MPSILSSTVNLPRTNSTKMDTTVDKTARVESDR